MDLLTARYRWFIAHYRSLIGRYRFLISSYKFPIGRFRFFQNAEFSNVLLALTWWGYGSIPYKTRWNSAMNKHASVMFGYVRLCLVMFGYVRVCSGMFGYVRVCWGMFGYVRLCLAMGGYVWLCSAPLICLEIWYEFVVKYIMNAWWHSKGLVFNVLLASTWWW